MLAYDLCWLQFTTRDLVYSLSHITSHHHTSPHITTHHHTPPHNTTQHHTTPQGSQGDVYWLATASYFTLLSNLLPKGPMKKPEKLVNQFFMKDLVNPKPKTAIKIGLIGKIDAKPKGWF